MIRDRIGGWIFKNAGWRLLSLALALAIWMSVATEPEMSTFVSAPVQYKDPPDYLEVAARPGDTVQLETRGSSGQLRDLANSRPAITLDFSGVREPGDRTFTITRSETNLPRGVEFLRATPAQIRFHFEHREKRYVPVTVRFQGKLPDGLHLESFAVQPPSKQIAGPELQVRAIREALTDSINLSLISGKKAVVKTNLYLQDPQVRFISEPRVTVTMVLK